MGLLDLFRRSAEVWTPPPDSDDYWYQPVGVASTAGVEVDETTAIKCSAFFACERVICEDISSLPLVVYERTGAATKRRATEDHRYALLHDQPNYLMAAMGFREALTRHAVRWGNGYAWIEYQGNTGRIAALWPLRPDRMKVARTESGRIVYRYRFDTEMRDYLPEEILHIAGPGFDGLRGYSIVSLARDSIGLGMAAERFGARLFANDARPGMVLEHPGPHAMSDVAYERLKKSWSERHQGVDNAHKAAIVEEGIKVHEIGFPPEDIQFIKTREHQVREMCRWFRMQPHKIGDLRDATFSNIEQQSIEHVTETIRPWCVRWEQSIAMKLFGPTERDRLFAEHNMEGLLRGDIKSRYDAYAIGKQWGFLSTNDIRDKENMNPVDGGDEYLVPLNMIPATSVGAIPKGGEPKPPKEIAPKRSLRTLTPAEWQEAYESGGAHWAEDLDPSLFVQEFVLELQERGVTRPVLEIGCGGGRDSIFMARAGFDVTGIDAAPAAVELAQKNAGEAKVDVTLQVANAEALPFGAGQFGAVFTLSVLHASDLNKSIPETARVLAPGGLMLVHIYSDTSFADGTREEYTTVDAFMALLKNSGYTILDFYSEEDEEFDASGEKHQVLVGLCERTI